MAKLLLTAVLLELLLLMVILVMELEFVTSVAGPKVKWWCEAEEGLVSFLL